MTISKVRQIPDADKLDIVEMEGKAWRVMTDRNDFRPGNTAVYYEIDSALAADGPRYGFLRERCLKSFRTKQGNFPVWIPETDAKQSVAPAR